MRAWEPHLPAAGRIEVLPDITHALTHLGTDDPAAMTPQDVGTQVDASVVDALADWLDEVLAR